MLINLICQLGSPTRGVSPYGDALLSALGEQVGVDAVGTNFKSAYPGILHPARNDSGEHGLITWYNPISWAKAVNSPADIVHLQHWAPPLSSYLLPMMAMAKRAKKKVVITAHNPEPHESAGIFEAIERRMYRFADILIVHSLSGRDSLMSRLGKHAPDISIIPHGMSVVDTPQSPSCDDFKTAELDPEFRYILMFGNLRPYKGVDVMLNAWSLIRHYLPDVRLVIAGQMWDGRKRPASRLASTILRTRSHGRMDFLDYGQLPSGVILNPKFLSDTTLDALIRVSELVVCPYRHFSGQSGAACRAAALGRPVLVSQVGALPELAVDANWVIPPGDAVALAKALIKVLSLDGPQASIRMQQLEVARAFSWSSVAARHAKLYESLT